MTQFEDKYIDYHVMCVITRDNRYRIGEMSFELLFLQPTMLHTYFTVQMWLFLIADKIPQGQTASRVFKFNQTCSRDM